MIYDGIFELLCRSSLVYTPELKAMVEAKLCSFEPEIYAHSRTLTTFACKLLLKLPFSSDSTEKLVKGMIKFTLDNKGV